MFKNSDGSGMEKVGFGRVRLYPNFQMSGSGMSSIEKVGFGREMKFRASSIFEERLKSLLDFKISVVLGIQKVGFGRILVYPYPSLIDTLNFCC